LQDLVVKGKVYEKIDPSGEFAWGFDNYDFIINVDGKSYKALMQILDIFSISGNKVVLVGQIRNNSIKLNDEILIVGDNFQKRTTAMGIVKNNKEVYTATKGDFVGVLIKNINKDEIKTGYYLVII
jgi:translation elongation factor EF-Tu-like GTPase